MPLTRNSGMAAITRFQLDLQRLGYDVGASGADGYLGPRTRGGAHDFAEDYNLTSPTNGEIPDDVVALVTKLAAEKASAPLALPENYFDLSDKAFTGPRKGVRPWSQITGIGVHQTACWMGERAERWANHKYRNKEGVLVQASLKAHYGITRQGKIYRVHPEQAFVWHAQQLSKDTIGFEFDGSFPGIEGDLSTWYKGYKEPMKPTDEQIVAGMELTRYLGKLLARNGSSLVGIYPHRIATDDRTGSRRRWEGLCEKPSWRACSRGLES
jgi:hypothetical protein